METFTHDTHNIDFWDQIPFQLIITGAAEKVRKYETQAMSSVVMAAARTASLKIDS